MSTDCLDNCVKLNTCIKFNLPLIDKLYNPCSISNCFVTKLLKIMILDAILELNNHQCHKYFSQLSIYHWVLSKRISMHFIYNYIYMQNSNVLFRPFWIANSRFLGQNILCCPDCVEISNSSSKYA